VYTSRVCRQRYVADVDGVVEVDDVDELLDVVPEVPVVPEVDPVEPVLVVVDWVEVVLAPVELVVEVVVCRVVTVVLDGDVVLRVPAVVDGELLDVVGWELDVESLVDGRLVPGEVVVATMVVGPAGELLLAPAWAPLNVEEVLANGPLLAAGNEVSGDASPLSDNIVMAANRAMMTTITDPAANTSQVPRATSRDGELGPAGTNVGGTASPIRSLPRLSTGEESTQPMGPVASRSRRSVPESLRSAAPLTAAAGSGDWPLPFRGGWWRVDWYPSWAWPAAP
jgi:hypothetical protein